jgi:hypothetical protein
MRWIIWFRSNKGNVEYVLFTGSLGEARKRGEAIALGSSAELDRIESMEGQCFR